MRTTLVTGASGVVGRAVAAELGEDRVIALVHENASVPEADVVVAGDLAAPRLGLGEAAWRELAAEVDVVVHSGALTEWGQPAARYEAVNVGGTKAVVDLARAAGASVHLISTCFVHALERGGAAALSESNVVKPYVVSKLASERLLAASGVPHTIWRPTNLVGDSRTGASASPQIVQRLSDWICRGKAPFFPLHPGNLVDVAPLDVLAIAVARAIETGDRGGPYWVTYGAGALTLDGALDILVEHARSLGREIERAPAADPREPLPVPLDRVAPMSRAFLKVLVDVSEVTHACGGVLPSSLDALERRFGMARVSDAEAYRLSLAYWATERAGAAAAAGGAR